jgi:hypothetical protein
MAVRWEAGAHVVVRNVWHGRVFSAYPFVVVEDTADLVVLFIPAGAVWKKPSPCGRLQRQDPPR